MQFAASDICQLDLIGVQAMLACTWQLAGFTYSVCCRQCVPVSVPVSFVTAFKVLALSLMHAYLLASG